VEKSVTVEQDPFNRMMMEESRRKEEIKRERGRFPTRKSPCRKRPVADLPRFSSILLLQKFGEPDDSPEAERSIPESVLKSTASCFTRLSQAANRSGDGT